MHQTYELSVLSGAFVVIRMAPSTAVPTWALETAQFVAVTRTEGELSIICSEQQAPRGATDRTRWHALKVHGPFPFETVGVLAALSAVLAGANVSLLAISTHDTDYLFVRSVDFARAVRALRHEGHTVHTDARS